MNRAREIAAALAGDGSVQLTSDEWNGWIVHYYTEHYPAGPTAVRGCSNDGERTGHEARALYTATRSE